MSSNFYVRNSSMPGTEQDNDILELGMGDDEIEPAIAVSAVAETMWNRIGEAEAVAPLNLDGLVPDFNLHYPGKHNRLPRLPSDNALKALENVESDGISSTVTNPHTLRRFTASRSVQRKSLVVASR